MGPTNKCTLEVHEDAADAEAKAETEASAEKEKKDEAKERVTADAEAKPKAAAETKVYTRANADAKAKAEVKLKVEDVSKPQADADAKVKADANTKAEDIYKAKIKMNTFGEGKTEAKIGLDKTEAKIGLDERTTVRVSEMKFGEVNDASLFECAKSSPPTSTAKTEALAKTKSMSFLGCTLMLGLAITTIMVIKRYSAGKWVK